VTLGLCMTGQDLVTEEGEGDHRALHLLHQVTAGVLFLCC